MGYAKKKTHLLKFLALENLGSLANQQINSFFHIHLTLARTSFSNQQINAKKKKTHLLKFFALENLESLANQQINTFLHIHLTLARTSFSNQQINVKKNSPIENFDFGKFKKP